MRGPWTTVRQVGEVPLPDREADELMDWAFDFIRGVLQHHPEIRAHFVAWAGRGIAFLFRCPVCVFHGDSGFTGGRSYSVHVPDGVDPDSTDRIALYPLCAVHEKKPTDVVVVAVKWWAVLDGDTEHPGRIILFYNFGGVSS